MNLPVILDEEAQRKYDAAFDYYDDEKPGLGTRFAEEVQYSLDRIAANPRIHAVVLRDIRKAVLKTFPYCIYYTIEPTFVFVTAVFHTSRDPDIWKGRR